MARLSHVPLQSPRSNGSSFERSTAELGQLLWRMQQALLHPEPEKERQLRTSEYERARQRSNLDYARDTLTKLEQDALGVLAPGRRSEVQADLTKKRELYEVLVDRLQDLDKIAADAEDDEEDDSSDIDDDLAGIIPTPSDDTDTQPDFPTDPPETTATATTATTAPTTTTAPTATQSAQPTPTPDSQQSAQELPTQTEQTLRARTTAPTTTSPSPSDQPTHATARAALFANRSRNRPIATGAGTETSTATAEAILDAQAAEREDLATKVFEMARAMKNQQKNIASSLDAEKDVLGRATHGMERTERGMEVAKGRMGALQRVTEGKGWWGRVILYAWVYGLMLGLVVLVFVFPKLRF